jgi:hypothetical protein
MTSGKEEQTRTRTTTRSKFDDRNDNRLGPLLVSNRSARLLHNLSVCRYTPTRKPEDFNVVLIQEVLEPFAARPHQVVREISIFCRDLDLLCTSRQCRKSRLHSLAPLYQCFRSSVFRAHTPQSRNVITLTTRMSNCLVQGRQKGSSTQTTSIPPTFLTVFAWPTSGNRTTHCKGAQLLGGKTKFIYARCILNLPPMAGGRSRPKISTN